TNDGHDAHHDDHHDDHAGNHLSDWEYIKIGIWLAILTAIEVALFYFPPGGAEVPALLILMVVKFAIVAAYFMHLKGDKPVLTQVFVGGLLLAVAVYFAVFFAFELF
ncbi:MAG: cytochrome C oxidase subunit IV family protein, partial [Actinomycetota bacterium]